MGCPVAAMVEPAEGDESPEPERFRDEGPGLFWTGWQQFGVQCVGFKVQGLELSGFEVRGL